MMTINNSSQKISDHIKGKLQSFWARYSYLVIDEYSMLGKTFLAKLSNRITIGKTMGQFGDMDRSFGNMNVILCGDLHQFPPVATARSELLYTPALTSLKSNDAQIGRHIYDEFSSVVVLHKQMRVQDPIWHDFLQNLRFGHVQQPHLDLLRTLLIDRNPDDYSSTPWNEAILITPRHSVRTKWNEAALKRHCQKNNHRLFICPAEDRVRGQLLSVQEQLAMKLRSQNQKQRHQKDLPDEISFAIGARVLVTQNIDVDLDVTNGVSGEIVDIILHPNEPPFDESASQVHLQYLPLYLLVKMNHTRASRLFGLEDGVIPIEPTSRTITICLKKPDGTTLRRSVQRHQFPMTLGWAFTDYRSQGQTIPYIIIDIAKPPSGKLNLFNLYVALSRSHGRHSVRLLRDFDDEIFLTQHDPCLSQEDDRLQDLNDKTKIWWSQMK
jgi:hypothetical protein